MEINKKVTILRHFIDAESFAIPIASAKHEDAVCSKRPDCRKLKIVPYRNPLNSLA
jgi:hypothetical protein